MDADGPRRIRIELSGTVQGMGFRPFVYRLAHRLGLSGSVCNTGAGLRIEAEAADAVLAEFLDRLEREAPAQARVTARHVTGHAPSGSPGFVMAPSREGDTSTATVLPDLAPCADCLRELDDPADRRHRYPFITCVQCGPRYSVIEALPYDRARTTLRHFPLCPACAAEYSDPASRRFHAESICCPSCGPRLALWQTDGTVLATAEPALQQAAAALCEGRILALKGLGGFQLLADARDEAALQRLRARKRRLRKPFALLVADMQAAEALAEIGEAEAALLRQPAAPIVLLRARPGTALAASVAAGNPNLGLMLPATPLHHLLARAAGFPLVATSGNLSGGPILADETDALRGLAGVADLFLVHDRPIARPLDDSVARIIDGAATVLRHARGYAPLALACPALQTPILALGGHQKNALATGFAGQILLGPHIGDLDGADARAAFATAATALPALHRLTPARLACDAHPDYASTHHATALGLPTTRVPHHLAHALSGMLDRGLAPPVLAVAWDGAGHGGDGTIHGGEFLVIGADRWRRAAHLLAFRLPGAAAAIREPRRAALGALFALHGESALAMDALPPVAAFPIADRPILAAMLARSLNAPLTSSAGRLFDAVAALLGLIQHADFEGEAAMALEAAADAATHSHPLPPPALLPDAGRLVLDWRPTLAALLAAHADGVAAPPLAAGFHAALADAIVATACRLGINRVLLTGGCFQNARLAGLAAAGLRAAGMQAFCHRDVPPNDGGLAVGQLVFAAHPLSEETG